MHENSGLTGMVASKVLNVTTFVSKYDHLFTGDRRPHGYCGKVRHEIPVTSGKVRPFTTRRVLCHLEGEVERQVTEMFRDDIIEEADSPYSSPVLLVIKATGNTDFVLISES